MSVLCYRFTMQKALEVIRKHLSSPNFNNLSFSDKRDKSAELRGVIVKPTNSINDFKVEYRLSKHNDIKTVTATDLLEEIEAEYLNNFKQVHLKLNNQDIQILFNKKRVAKIISKKVENTSKVKHNRDKKYLIPDGEPCTFLFEIGVMDRAGRVKPNYYKKFRQINRFLEMVDDLYKNEELESIHAVDFGCGKSYLTFALFHYFQNIKKIKTNITGIDLKQEVIDHCNDIALRLDYSGLKFAHGFIHDFKTDKDVDFVVTLHACDTATDDAILFSLANNAKNMIFVPCCQHELNKQLKSVANKMLLESGLFRDRMCSLVTDTVRAKLLEALGFKVQIMEFITLEHTAKNVMLRCSKVERDDSHKNKLYKEYCDFAKEWQIKPYLSRMLNEQNYFEGQTLGEEL
jgi:hypothetical protein